MNDIIDIFNYFDDENGSTYMHDIHYSKISGCFYMETFCMDDNDDEDEGITEEISTEEVLDIFAITNFWSWSWDGTNNKYELLLKILYYGNIPLKEYYL